MAGLNGQTDFARFTPKPQHGRRPVTTLSPLPSLAAELRGSLLSNKLQATPAGGQAGGVAGMMAVVRDELRGGRCRGLCGAWGAGVLGRAGRGVVIN